MSDDLQERFAQALRKALDMPVADVLPPAMEITLAPPVDPVPVVDVQRFGGAFESEVQVVRNPDGFMNSARLIPVRFIPFPEDNQP